MAALHDLLHKLFIINGVTAVAVITGEGRVVESLETETVDDAQLAAVISFVMAESGVMARKFGKEHLSLVYLEFQDRVLISVPLNGQFVIVFIAKPNTNIAQIHAELKRDRDMIVGAL